MVNLKEEIRTYWDSRHNEYDKSPGHNTRSDEEKEVWINALKRNLNLDKNSKILDVGTGTGFLSLLLAESGYKVAGIDLSEKMLSKAIEKSESNRLDIEFQVGDAENPPFEDESFDAIVSRHVLWTLPNPENAIREWHRILKPRGKVIIIDGEWSSDSISSKLRRFAGYSTMFITERRNPWKWQNHHNKIKNKLPFNGGTPPTKVESLLYENGYSNVWIDNLSDLIEAEKKNAPFYYRIMHSKKSRYLIGGEKR
ncbi:MAG: class I SAM-dependent methyltransferase [Candidatus Altiarchaeales archaeon]|nr:class I SAM-dependent methyltransferase [Candidatus Altiarchaeota archaeon]MCG2782096.1 class I SAM-dependent methyltransferase [Candidatus Altiarchaeales archaeon]MBU4265635.1 class I SAM-dependent methyltransferase [Candidatus Altiarchaeota archaeon]MBU4341052.1 class I SAM-dependent methyltransferase [Candidatus Altiarchaeota archaeon]MBU4406038.1 class I SAM-dependent methyltransferase [Candidatus Altiarchaeota archaeon]